MCDRVKGHSRGDPRGEDPRLDYPQAVLLNFTRDPPAPSERVSFPYCLVSLVFSGTEFRTPSYVFDGAILLLRV
jgi:hypothetical protein